LEKCGPIELAEVKSDLDSKLVVHNARNESRVHVSKIQYEKEFINYARTSDLVSPKSHQCQILCDQKQSYEFYKKEITETPIIKQ
jgi:hypothetical protein